MFAKKYNLVLAACGLMFSVVPQQSWAVPIERPTAGETFTQLANGVIVITTEGETYTITTLPLEAQGMEFSIDPKKLKRSKYVNGLDFGVEISEQEIEKILDIYFKNVAYDYDSIRLRNLDIRPRQYAVWCDGIVMLGLCDLGWQGRAGAVVFFESDGKNLSGGRTGYRLQGMMVRKVAKTT